MSITNTYNSTAPVTESNNYVVVSKFVKKEKAKSGYQTEQELENKLISDLLSLGYGKLEDTSTEGLEKNLRIQLAKLNNLSDGFTDEEWNTLKSEYLYARNDTLIEKTRKIQENHIYDLKIPGQPIKNIKIIDKENIHNNSLQVAHQIKQEGTSNRYDVTIFVNGLPLVQVELKKRGVNLKEAFNQIHRYSNESFNQENSLFKFIQIFVISNGTFTKYFANTTATNKNNYEFTCEWTDEKNNVIHDLEDFTEYFLNRRFLLSILTKYCVFDTNNTLLIMRPYQIAATERILLKIYTSHCNKNIADYKTGGYIWHTTGSGKTLTSFKTAKLATQLPYIDKVFFVVDRKDLDYQTVKEYKRFDAESVNGSNNVDDLKRVIERSDNKIIVTTIQKLNKFVKKYENHPIYSKECVLIFDECHRSQFGQSQNQIKRKFKKSYQFGFTGTPIFTENSVDGQTTESIFGTCLHKYIITDAIRDNKVLKFKVDYYNVSAKFKDAEADSNIDQLEDSTIVNQTINQTTNKTVNQPANQDSTDEQEDNKQLLLHPDRISSVTSHILNIFDYKTSRNVVYNLKQKRMNGFNAMFAVQSIEAAQLYYQEFKKQQAKLPVDKRLKVATIFSFVENEEQKVKGDIADESYDVSKMQGTSKEFLNQAINEYNEYFGSNFSCESRDSFEQFYRDLSQHVKDKEIDLLIVVGMFLTGFDAPTLNTLFVDKNLQYHGLIQAFSRTNRILNDVKKFGNIVCFRDLSEATKNAIKLFGVKDYQDTANLIIQPTFEEVYYGYTDQDGDIHEGYLNALNNLETFNIADLSRLINSYSDHNLVLFTEYFGEYLKQENIIKFYDDYYTDKCRKLEERKKQDYKSFYLEILEKTRASKNNHTQNPTLDFSAVSFELDLLKTEDINCDYILKLIIQKLKDSETSQSELASTSQDLSQVDSYSLNSDNSLASASQSIQELLINDISKVTKSSITTRKQLNLITKFIKENFESLLELKSKNDDEAFVRVAEIFFKDYVPKERKADIEHIITSCKLRNQAIAYGFINECINNGYVERTGTEVTKILPAMSRFGSKNATNYKKTKDLCLDALQNLVDVYANI